MLHSIAVFHATRVWNYLLSSLGKAQEDFLVQSYLEVSYGVCYEVTVATTSKRHKSYQNGWINSTLK